MVLQTKTIIELFKLKDKKDIMEIDNDDEAIRRSKINEGDC